MSVTPSHHTYWVASETENWKINKTSVTPMKCLETGRWAPGNKQLLWKKCTFPNQFVSGCWRLVAVTRWNHTYKYMVLHWKPPYYWHGHLYFTLKLEKCDTNRTQKMFSFKIKAVPYCCNQHISKCVAFTLKVNSFSHLVNSLRVFADKSTF